MLGRIFVAVELGELIEDAIRAVFGNRRTGGRPREHTAAEWLLFQVAVYTALCGQRTGT